MQRHRVTKSTFGGWELPCLADWPCAGPFRGFLAIPSRLLDTGHNMWYSGSMFISEPEKITDLAQVFLQPANATHRQYEALRAYFVDRLLVSCLRSSLPKSARERARLSRGWGGVGADRRRDSVNGLRRRDSRRSSPGCGARPPQRPGWWTAPWGHGARLGGIPRGGEPAKGQQTTAPRVLTNVPSCYDWPRWPHGAAGGDKTADSFV